ADGNRGAGVGRRVPKPRRKRDSLRSTTPETCRTEGRTMRVPAYSVRIRGETCAKPTGSDRSRRESRPLDERLGLDEGEFVREGVERGGAQPARDRLDDHHAQRREAEPVAGAAVEHQPP